MTFRAVACLPALTGAWRDRGGGLTGLAVWFMRSSLRMDRRWMPELEDQSLRSVNMVQLGRALTDPAMHPPGHALFGSGRREPSARIRADPVMRPNAASRP